MTEYDGQFGRDMPEDDAGRTGADNDADEDDLQVGLSGLAGLVAGGQSVDELLYVLAEFATYAVPDVDGSSVSLMQPRDPTLPIQTWAVTAQFVRDIDKLQYAILKEGPCITCMHSRRPTVSGSLGSDERWPHFGSRAAGLGVHSALSLPLLVAGEVIGAINCYAHAPDTFTDHDVQMGTRFATPAAVSLYNTQLLTQARERVDNLIGALRSRAVINQAIGILRGSSGFSEDEGFTALQRMSQSENVKVYVVAQRLVDDAVRRANAPA